MGIGLPLQEAINFSSIMLPCSKKFLSFSLIISLLNKWSLNQLCISWIFRGWERGRLLIGHKLKLHSVWSCQFNRNYIPRSISTKRLRERGPLTETHKYWRYAFPWILCKSHIIYFYSWTWKTFIWGRPGNMIDIWATSFHVTRDKIDYFLANILCRNKHSVIFNCNWRFFFFFLIR